MSQNSVYFTETMHGFISKTTDSFQGKRKNFLTQVALGKEESLPFKFLLTIYIEDIDAFINDKSLKAKASGYIDSPLFGGRCSVIEGDFNLFLNPISSKEFDAAKEMHYRLTFRDSKNECFDFFGYKVLQKEDGFDIWQETTTLYSQIFKSEESDKPIYAGVLELNVKDFAKQMTTLNSDADSFIQKIANIKKFLNIFAENIWEAYAPQLFNTVQEQWDYHEFPTHTSIGVQNAKIEHHFLDLPDGITIQIDRFKRKRCKNIVVLFHGLSTSTDMFIMPEHYNIVSYLLNNEYTDVFSVDWRGSGRLKYNYIPNKYNLDYVAKYDIPCAISEIKKIVGESVDIHIVAHCVGSLSVAASLSSGQLEGIKSFYSNCVTFTPKIHPIAKFKISIAPFFLDNILGYAYLSPQIPYMPGIGFGKFLALLHRMLRHECKEPACHMVSFMWGWGFPAAYEHENISEITHRRVKDLFGATSTSYYRHLGKMARAQETLVYRNEKEFFNLPPSYLMNLKNVNLPPTRLVAGAKNKIFPGSNKLTYERIQEIAPHQDVEYIEFENYGHQDIFIGKDSATDIFPTILEFLNKHRS